MTTLMLRRHACCVRWVSTAKVGRLVVTTVMLVRRTPTAIRPQRVWLAWRVSTLVAMPRHVLTAPAVVRTSTGTLRRYARSVTWVSTRLLVRLCAVSVIRTRWTMTLIHRHRVWRVLLATCRFLVRLSALRVQLVSSIVHLQFQRCARCVRWVSIRMSRLRARALIVLLVSTRMLLDLGAARTVCLASTRVQRVCGSATSASWVVTLQLAHLSAQCVRLGAVMMTVIRRHHVLLVRQVSTRVLSGQTAQHVWLVGPIMTAILRASACNALKVTMLRLV